MEEKGVINMLTNSWTKDDINSVIIYLTLNGEKETIAIYDINVDVPNTVECVNYPIAFDSKISRNAVGIPRNQRKPKTEALINPGDWMHLGRVSVIESEELRRLSHTRRNLSDNF